MHDVEELLANYPGLGRIRLCECNSIHLSIGPVTLNLDPAAFMQMATLVGNAAERLSAIRKLQNTTEDTSQMSGPSQSRMTH